MISRSRPWRDPYARGYNGGFMVGLWLRLPGDS